VAGSGTVYALSLTLIAAVYIGFAVAAGQPAALAAESGVAGVCVVLAAIAVTGPAWLLVLGLHRPWAQGPVATPPPLRGEHTPVPPFCLVVDWVVAAILVLLITAGLDFY
jgi:hypothetical protein